MPLLDSHCHLDRFFREGILDHVLTRAEDAGVDKLVAIGTEPRDWAINRELAATYPETIAYTVGLHPNEVESDWEKNLENLKNLLFCNPAPVAVGEIGLDYFRLPQEETKATPLKDLQKTVFASQLNMAREAGLPVVIHCRASFQDCLTLIDESGMNWGKVVFHCFSEGPEELEQLRARGGRASFTGIITYGNAEEIRQAALTQGLDALMLETDCPYLSPEPLRGKTNEPAYLRHTAAFCADLFDTDLDTLSSRTTDNATAFYDLKKE